ncbi:MAG: flagellar basal body rod C-terminal domain-containing protein [Cycloclasticus sp.]
MDSVSSIQRASLDKVVTDLNRLSTNVANANSVGFKAMTKAQGVHSQDLATIKKTDNKNDLLASGNNFFGVLDGSALKLAKSVTLIKDNIGYLRTETGYFITEQGQRIQLNEGSWRVDDQAQVIANGDVVALIDTFKVENQESLKYAGDGLYLADYSLATSNSKILVGFRELSNVNVSSEMLEIMTVQNKFKSQSTLMKSYGAMMDYSINLLK